MAINSTTPRTSKRSARQRIYPSQPWKSRKVTISGVEYSAVLNGQRGQLGICGPWASNLSLNQHPLKDGPMALGRRKWTDLSQRHPTLNNANRRFCWEAISCESAVGADPDKGGDRLPREAKHLRAGKHLFQPGPCGKMLDSHRVMGVDQQIGVRNDHR